MSKISSKNLQDALKAKQIIPFVGAGVSSNVQKKEKDSTKAFDPLFPSWGKLIEILADALRNINKTGDAEFVLSCLKTNPPKYLDAMQQAFDSLGEKRWYEIFDKTFNLGREQAEENSLEAPRLVWELGSELIITTNIDLVLQWSCPNPNPPRILDAQTVEYGKLQNEKNVVRPTIWHLHGHIDNIENIIFTKRQYEAFYDEKSNEAKLRTLLTFLTQRNFLFIGFSLSDPYFLKQLEYIHKIYRGAIGSFYVLLHESEKHSPIPNFVEKIFYEDYGEPFREVLREMRDIAKGSDSEKGDVAPEESEPPILLKSDSSDSFSNIPFPSKGAEFVGREGKLEEIWNALTQGGRAAIGQAVSIKGIGGLGKTQLAVEYAHYYHNKTNKEVYWLTADQDLDNQLIQIALKKKWLSETDKDFDQAEVARNRFRELSDCLIVFDNVETPESIKNYLPKDRETTHILITSREKQSGFRQVDLDVLSLLHASDLLLKVAEREPENDLDEKGLEEILKQLEGLPLALELVGGYLKEYPNVSFAKYFEFLQDVPLDRLEAEFPEDNFTGHDKSIIRTLKISEKLLAAKPILNDILDVLAWSGTASMGISLLRDLVGTKDDFALLTALGDAINLRLIRKEDGERYAIHRLLAKVRRHENPLENRKEWHLEKIERLKEWFYKRKDDFNKLLKFEAEIEHLKEWQKQSSKIAPSETTYLLALRAYPLWHRGNYQESKILLEEALNLYNEKQIEDGELLSNLYNDLGVIINGLGNIQKAFEYKQKALEINQNLPHENLADLSKILNNLGSTYDDLGNHQEALKLKQQALEMSQGLFGEKHPDVANTLNNLGSSYDYLGNHQEALKFQQQALEMRVELFGEKHPDVALSLNNLGTTYSELGNHQEALKLKQQALEMRVELFGEKHPAVASSLNNLGTTYGKLGNHQEALKLKQQALEMNRELFGEKHSAVASSLNNLGRTYSNLGNKNEAVNHYNSALEMRRSLLGERHPHTILTCFNLISVLLKTGGLEKAVRLAREFLNYVPPNHPDRKFFEHHAKKHRKRK